MQEYIISPCGGKAFEAAKGALVTVTDICGGQVADFFAQMKNNPDEFISPGVTIDCNESLKLNAGNYIYSNLYRPMFQVVQDDVSEHDLIHPCCRKEMYDFFYRNGEGHPNCLDNLNSCLHGDRKIIQPINLFMNTRILPSGKIAVLAPLSKAGDKIVLKALEDVLIGIAACSVSESSCNGGKCTPIKAAVSD